MPRFGVIATWLGLVWLALAAAPLRAALPEPLPAPRPGDSQSIEFEFLHDPTGSFEIDDVAVRDDLVWQQDRTVFSRNGAGVLWLRMPALEGFDIIDIGTLPDEALLYEAAPGQFNWRVQQTGDTISLSQRSLNSPRGAFRLSEQITAADIRYIKIVQHNVLRFTISAWREEDFRAAEDLAQAIRILILGFVIAIIIYNCVVSVFARDWLFALNALTITSFVFLDLYLTGAGGVWLWPQQAWLSNLVLCFSIAGIVGFGSRFMLTMLRERDKHHVWVERLTWFGWAAALLTVCSLIFPYWMIVLALVPLAIIFLGSISALAVSLAWQGNRQAQLLLVPLSLSVIPGLAVLLTNIWTEAEFGWLSQHVLEITLMLEALCFSLVLATRIRMHRAEAIEARSALAELRAQAAERFSSLQDQERARIAADLHDGLGHSLALASAQFEMAMQDESVGEEAGERLAHGLTSLRSAIAETRRISHALHPATLAHLGWQTALQSIVDDFASGTNVAVELEISCDEECFGTERQIHLLRLVQEALSNIERHASADWCKISVVESVADIAVSIEDNGVGKGLEVQSDTRTLGLFSMRQRARQMGGKLSIDAREPRGLVVSFSAPSEKALR